MQRQLELSNVTFFEADLETCDLQTLGQFDAVYNVGLLYHVADPFRVLQQCAAVAPGGGCGLAEIPPGPAPALIFASACPP